MRIAVVSPLFEDVPPKLYGGTERIVSYLTEELVRQGQDVTLFASGASQTGSRLRTMCPRGLRLDPECVDPLAHHMLMLDHVIAAAAEFDVIHFNIDYLHFPAVRHLHLPAITTLHGRLDGPDLSPLYRHFADTPLVSISDAQRQPMPWANWLATVHHGLPEDLYALQPGLGSYLAFLGRLSPEKRPDRAISIARRAGIPLKIAAKVDPTNQAYFDTVLRPLIDGPDVEFIGEIGEAEKADFLGNALAMLFPIDWPEPFGLVMIEAMACGTPVIAWPCGAVPEVIDDGISGFIVKNEEEALKAIDKAMQFDRQRCRRVFEQRFTAARMAGDYLATYRRLLERDQPAL
ncbi:MAG: glycosyltransferase family 4 protein [Bacteroidota bacterium]